MSSKSILTILTYTVSKFARFFLRHSVKRQKGFEGTLDKALQGGACKLTSCQSLTLDVGVFIFC